MLHPSRLLAGLVLAAAVSAPALAQTDFLEAPKVACLPDSVTRCSNGQCTTRPATQRDKADVLVIDFATKKVSIRRGGGPARRGANGVARPSRAPAASAASCSGSPARPAASASKAR